MRLIPAFLLRRQVGWSVAAGIVLLAAGDLVWRAGSRRPQYITATVTRGTIQRTVGMTGALNPLVTVQVGTYVSGTITKLLCDFNTDVVVDQVCAVVDPVPFQLIVDQDSADLGATRAQLKKDEAALVYAKIAYERDSKLVAEGTVSQDTVDSEKSAYDQGVAQVGLDRATIVQKEAALNAAKVTLGYTNIKSPVDGTVITRSIDVGQTVAASLQTPTLFIIAKDLTKLQVDSNVSEADVGEVRVGQDAYFSVQAFPGRTFRGKVWQIREGPITVQNVVTYDVVVRFDNPNRLLFPGMTADTHIVIDERHDVLRVPLPAIRFAPEGIGRTRAASPERAEGRPETVTRTSSEAASVGVPATLPSGARGDRGGERRREGGREGSGALGKAGGGERQAERRGERAGAGLAEIRSGGARAPEAGTGHRGRVWVLADGKLRPIEVTTGLDDGVSIEVSGQGLSAGDTVVVNQVSKSEEKKGAAPLSPMLRQGGPRL